MSTPDRNIRNPFEDLGLSKEFVGAILDNPPADLDTAIKGLRRVVSRVMHPDVSGSKPDSDDFYGKSLQASASIMGMTTVDKEVLARDFVTAKRGRTVKAKEPEFNSADLYSGRILDEIVEELVNNNESTTSAKGRRLLTTTTPSNPNVEINRQPPLLTPLLIIPDKGPLSWQVYNRVPLFSNLGNREAQGRPNETATRKLSSDVWEIIIPDLPKDVVSNRTSVKGILIDKTDAPINNIYGDDGNVIGQTSRAAEIPLPNGLLNIIDLGHPLIRDYFRQEETQPRQTDLYVVGTVESGYEKIERNRIYGKSVAERALPARANADHSLPMFPVTENMHRYAEKFYTPSIVDHERVLVADPGGMLHCLGKAAFMYRDKK